MRKSGCFTLLDRGKGFQMSQQERALASGGELQQGSNMGKGQVKAADYILVPDIASKNADASGTNIGGILGGFVGHGVGSVIAGLSIHSSTADVVLTIDNVRTGEEGPIEQGHGSKTDVGFGAAAAGAIGAAMAARAVSSYTEHRHRPGRDARLHRCLHQAGQRHGRAFAPTRALGSALRRPSP